MNVFKLMRQIIGSIMIVLFSVFVFLWGGYLWLKAHQWAHGQIDTNPHGVTRHLKSDFGVLPAGGVTVLERRATD